VAEPPTKKATTKKGDQEKLVASTDAVAPVVEAPTIKESTDKVGEEKLADEVCLIFRNFRNFRKF
jgi:hypothetical protein